MNFANEARGRITEGRNVLIRRRQQTNDERERDAIDEAITSLNDSLGLINQAALLDAAGAVIDATVAFERLVTSARLGPFDDYVAELEGVLNRVADLLVGGEIGEHLERAPEPPSSSARAPAPTEASPPAIPEAALPPIAASRDFAALRPEYAAWFQALVVRPESREKAAWHVAQLLKHQTRYREVGMRVNGVPWAIVGVIHAMECGLNFTGHLHNGDPLTSQTTHVPVGRPQTGTPPFPWEASAIDALTMEGFDAVTDWSIPRMLYLLEKYNGFGYRNRGLSTPYLWSFSNLYQTGKYVSDGHFDPEAVSKQCGAAVMLTVLMDRGVALS